MDDHLFSELLYWFISSKHRLDKSNVFKTSEIKYAYLISVICLKKTTLKKIYKILYIKKNQTKYKS